MISSGENNKKTKKLVKRTSVKGTTFEDTGTDQGSSLL